MRKLIYIMSLSHSGSTLLNLLLGCSDSCISLGEILKSIRLLKSSKGICTCDNEIHDCSIWGNLLKQLRNNTNLMNYYETLDKLFSLVDLKYGNDKIIIDSSKTIHYLDILINKIPKLDIKVIFVIKDLRSFIFSQVDRKKHSHLMKKDGMKRYYTTTVFYNLYSWVKRNYKLKRYLENSELDFIQVGYEELCFNPVKSLKSISQFIGINFDMKMLTPSESNSHIIRGNMMRRNPDKLIGVLYDYRWLYSKRIAFWSFLFFPFMNYNKKNVYSNNNDN